ncbi:MAG TPA: ribbon-helix-helix protein, CopG family [Mesorhizobium sp.]
MGEHRLALHLDDETMLKLEREARATHVSQAEIAEKAIRSFLDIQEFEREILCQRIAEADKGVFISGEAMHQWIESWGTEKELPPPEPDIFLPPRRA